MSNFADQIVIVADKYNRTRKERLNFQYFSGPLGPPDSVDLVRDRVGAVNINTGSPWFKHPRDIGKSKHNNARAENIMKISFH